MQPRAGSHEPAELHASPAQDSGLVPTQAPLWHESVWVQALPSSQVAPFATLLHVLVLIVGQAARVIPHPPSDSAVAEDRIISKSMVSASGLLS